MAAIDAVELSDDERDAFLGRGGTGVLSFASPADEPPHSIPVSYGYDAIEETFYFRLAVDEDSEKGDLPGRPVTFVVYGRDDAWRSVVAKGRLEETTAEGVEVDALSGLERTEIPFVEVFGRSPKQLSFEFYRLVPDILTARTESKSAL